MYVNFASKHSATLASNVLRIGSYIMDFWMEFTYVQSVTCLGNDSSIVVVLTDFNSITVILVNLLSVYSQTTTWVEFCLKLVSS